jgi:predicted metal-binding membrane protein
VALTLYHALSMSMPMGVAVRGGMAAEGLGGMAMGGMAAAGWSLGGALVFVALWTVMMAAMMLPAAAPMILIFAQAQARRARDVAVPTWIFVAGYLLVWMAAGVFVYLLVQVGGGMAARFAAADRAGWAPPALGATLVAAGLYQLTPLKRVCLSHCRSPFAFVARHWRDGALGMGLRHGAYCLGCCWALFAVLTAAGVMSLAWMLLLTLVVFAEKALPQGRRVSAVVGGALVVLGLAVAGGAVPMPWMA